MSLFLEKKIVCAVTLKWIPGLSFFFFVQNNLNSVLRSDLCLRQKLSPRICNKARTFSLSVGLTSEHTNYQLIRIIQCTKFKTPATCNTYLISGLFHPVQPTSNSWGWINARATLMAGMCVCVCVCVCAVGLLRHAL